MQEADNLIQGLKKDCQQEDMTLSTRVDEIGELMKVQFDVRDKSIFELTSEVGTTKKNLTKFKKQGIEHTDKATSEIYEACSVQLKDIKQALFQRTDKLRKDLDANTEQDKATRTKFDSRQTNQKSQLRQEPSFKVSINGHQESIIETPLSPKFKGKSPSDMRREAMAKEKSKVKFREAAKSPSTERATTELKTPMSLADRNKTPQPELEELRIK